MGGELDEVVLRLPRDHDPGFLERAAGYELLVDVAAATDGLRAHPSDAFEPIRLSGGGPLEVEMDDQLPVGDELLDPAVQLHRKRWFVPQAVSAAREHHVGDRIYLLGVLADDPQAAHRSQGSRSQRARARRRTRPYRRTRPHCRRVGRGRTRRSGRATKEPVPGCGACVSRFQPSRMDLAQHQDEPFASQQALAEGVLDEGLQALVGTEHDVRAGDQGRGVLLPQAVADPSVANRDVGQLSNGTRERLKPADVGDRGDRERLQVLIEDPREPVEDREGE